MEFRSCARGRQWCGIFHYHWWTASIKPRLLFSHSGLVSWGLPFLQFNICSKHIKHMFTVSLHLFAYLDTRARHMCTRARFATCPGRPSAAGSPRAPVPGWNRCTAPACMLTSSRPTEPRLRVKIKSLFVDNQYLILKNVFYRRTKQSCH